MHEIKKLRPFEINGNNPFSKQYLHTQAKNIFQSLKYFKNNDNISFLKTLMKIHIYIHFEKRMKEAIHFLKITLINIKTNVFSIHITHLWFANTNIQFI